MEDLAFLSIARGAERILIIVSGTFCVYFGYRLFLKVPSSRETSLDGKMWDFQISIKDTGPGAVFSLFGAAIIIFAISSPLSINNDSTQYSVIPQTPDERSGDLSLLMTLSGSKTIIENTLEKFNAEENIFSELDNYLVSKIMPMLASERISMLNRLFTLDERTFYFNLSDEIKSDTDLYKKNASEMFGQERIDYFMNMRAVLDPHYGEP